MGRRECAFQCERCPCCSAGGGFRHGQHLAFDMKNNYPLREPASLDGLAAASGIEANSFSSSKGTMRDWK